MQPNQNQVQQIIQQLLVSRGFDDEAARQRFLAPSYDQHLHDPYLLTDMKPAVERIMRAVADKEQIVIYGDYDIDGLTATAVLLETMRNLGHEATGYIPDRFEEGYGLNRQALQKLQKQGAQLVITVDCGITSVKEAAWARQNGLDLIITDHHAVPAQIPPAIAVINPKRPDDKYPFKDLAGVGVAFKLAQALQQATGRPAAGHEKWLLDLVALGTVCDVVTLVDENRVLVHYGLKVLHRTRRPGLRALAAVAGLSASELTSYHLGFMLGPRLNAAGRLEHAAQALQLLTTEDAAVAADIAEQLDMLNRERRQEQARILAAADEQAMAYLDDPVLVLAAPDWSHGIVGIVASKLVEKWRKPTLVMQQMGKSTKGSGRSVAGYNLIEALRTMPELFDKYGGHYFAAGCTLPTDQLETLRAGLIRYYHKLPADDLQLSNNKQAELMLSDWACINWDLEEALRELEPHGSGNPKPIFGTASAKVIDVKPVGADQSHLRLVLADASGRTLPAIGFGLATRHPNLKPGDTREARFQLTRNDWQGRSDLQLTLVELV